jgi:hypothetical protein
VSSPALEACLARLYADEAALARFLADPDAVLAASGLDPAERAALAAIDRNGLVMASRSFRAKRSGRAKPRRFERVRRALAAAFR